MAWTGDIKQHVWGVEPMGKGSILLFDCGHQQPVFLSVDTVLATLAERRFETICEECSAPHRARIREIQQSISFDDVLEKLKELGREGAS